MSLFGQIQGTREHGRRRAKDEVRRHQHHPFIRDLEAEGMLDDFIEYMAEVYHLGR